MPSHHQLAAATRIGMLTREHDTAAACAEALRELALALPLDMATLLTRDPLTGAHLQLAGIGSTAQASEALAVEFVTTPWYRNVMTRDLPPSISADAEDLPEYGPRFREGWFYAERVRPAGFRDGMTGALRHRDRLVGMVHLYTRRPDAYDTDARRLLASVMPAFAALADPAASVAGQLPTDAGAALVTPDAVLELPGRTRPEVLREAKLRHLVGVFAGASGLRVRLLWPGSGGTWYRVALRRPRPTPGIAPDAVLIHESPTLPPYGLSPRELEVLTLAAMGWTNRAIAEALFVSPRTVHTHIEHLLRKTGAASRAEATALAVRDGLLCPAPEHLAFFVER
ncbi:helix-turn-helix transcriptional regulator [Streptomyces lanatus]|uniref:Response regulator transcription factor n=1 Tax=Streptomyces lanatus TaxID=66900 RepID=A0ABV1XRN6_9ACTN|nr:response regulator transcription factor [Streptomyces lanatus]GHH04758.1 hypothetical protein GCM10018780_35530 [Streptomyces lanatus]